MSLKCVGLSPLKTEVNLGRCSLKIVTKAIDLEKQLHRRLKMMGVLFVVFSGIALIWDLFPTTENEIDKLLVELEEQPAPLNPYFVSSVFAAAGGFCFFIYWKKKKVLS